MTGTQLKTLRKRLPKGYVKILSDSLNLSPSMINKVLTGERNNDLVIDTAKSLADEYQKQTMRKIKAAMSS